MGESNAILSESEAKAVLPITADGRMFGTCFHVHREGGRSYLLTALHVLDEVERVGLTPTVDGMPLLARLNDPEKESRDRYENDLALLAIADLPTDVGVLPLSDELAANQSTTLWGYRVDPADPKYYRFHGIEASIKGSVGFLGQASGIGAHGLGLNLKTEQSIPRGFSGGPVYDPVTKGVLGITVSRQAEDRGDAVRTLGVASLLEFADASTASEWDNTIKQMLAPVISAIPIRRRVAPVDTSRLRRALNLYLVALFLCATASILLAYNDAPYAWQLQFNFRERPSCTSAAIGWIVEIVFTAIFLVIARLMLVWHFPDDFARVIETVLYPERAKKQLTTVGAGVLFAGAILFLATVVGLWLYHARYAPVNLEEWARGQLEDESKYKGCADDLSRLASDLEDKGLPAYRETYLKYFPYSLVNFALVAVPLAVVLATAAARDLAALSSFDKGIKEDLRRAGEFKDAREWFYLTRTMRGPFQDYRLHSERIVRRSLATFALYSPLAIFSVATTNLARSAFALAVFAAVVIFLGPLCCIVSTILSYRRQIESLHEAIDDSQTLSDSEKERRLQEFGKAYSDLMWITLLEDKLTVIGAAVYVLILVALLVYWQMR